MHEPEATYPIVTLIGALETVFFAVLECGFFSRRMERERMGLAGFTFSAHCLFIVRTSILFICLDVEVAYWAFVVDVNISQYFKSELRRVRAGRHYRPPQCFQPRKRLVCKNSILFVLPCKWDIFKEDLCSNDCIHASKYGTGLHRLWKRTLWDISYYRNPPIYELI